MAIYYWISFYGATSSVFAQDKKIKIIGNIIEERTKQPIAYATILIADVATLSPITGTTTLDDGSFSVETDDTDFYVEISFMGFASKKIETFEVNGNIIDLRTIALTEDFHMLNEVVISAEKSQTIFKLDKRIFNVGSDLSSTGASALDVLNNVPSVNVNIQGQISLRGSQGVQILIDGKPSAIASEQGNALGSLTADMIERIEVITNPSAKYDAEGTSGIINIVLKKEEKKGVNGSATLNTGAPNNHSFGLSLNKRTEKFNLFSQLGVGRRTFPWEEISENHNLSTNHFIQSSGGGDFNETYINTILGTDYFIDKLNIITLSGQFAYELEKKDAYLDFNFFEDDPTATNRYRRYEKATANNPKFRYELQYKKDFKRHKDQTLLFSALGHFFAKNEESTFTSNNTATDAAPPQIARNDYKLAEYIFKLDYTHPFLEKYTLETGSQYLINDVGNNYSISSFIGHAWEENPNLSNIFDYNQSVFALYATSAYEGEKWGIKLGLRIENTDLEIDLKNTSEHYQYDYTNLFPSVHTSYKIFDYFSLQAGYSKRISRPSLWDLNPFYDLGNNYYITTGNPNLQPEYTDSYEITSIHSIAKVSINWSVFYRHTKNVIEDVIVYEDNVSISRPDNVGINNVIGLELNAKYSPFDWLTLNNDFNYGSFNREGAYGATSLDFSGNRWSNVIIGKFKLPGNFSMEASGNYESGYQTFQQEISDSFYANFGLRKKIIKGKLILNLSIRDVFASRRYEYTTKQPDYYLFKNVKQGRFITFGVSYGFGKGEAMEFSGQKMF
tara:strand:- start:8630 stop:10993 length:2364 start_codon:yes stop_codon:yes gene_type:complete